MEPLYTAVAHATGDGRIGHTRANPEQLFAAGYAACFRSALKVAAQRDKRDVSDSEVSATVGVGMLPSGGFGVQVELDVHVPALDQQAAEALVAEPHGTLASEVPLGLVADPAEVPDAEEWGSPSLGGPTTTAGGLVFVGASRDGFFRAFDVETGELLWQDQLPAGGQATPMSYEHDGGQYVVIASGGHGKPGSQLGDAVVAYALPAPTTEEGVG